MDSNQFTPDNDCAGKMQKAEIIFGFLFETNQQFAETIEERMRDLYYPAPGFKVGILQEFLFFLKSGTDMRNITSFFNPAF